MQTRTKTEV